MRKLFTLTLALLASFSMWATDFVLFNGTGSTMPSSSRQTDATTGFAYTFANFKSSFTDVSSYTNHGSYKNAIRYGGGTTSSKNHLKIEVPEDYTAVIEIVYGGTSTNTKWGISTDGTKPNGSNCSVWNATATASSTLYSATIDDLESDTYYIGGSGDGCVIAYIKVTLSAVITTPTLTGAWKISSDTVTSANLMQESVATVPTFSVGATSGDPTGYYSVVYSLKAGSDEGIFTYTSSTFTGISTANAGSATIIATLTTTDNTKFLTPETNTFEYSVTVSAAAAPKFTSVTPNPSSSIARGTASTIEAVVTGTPDPTIQWYSCDDALKTNPAVVTGATDLTLNLANTAVGIYYYYAVASNTTTQLNEVASDVVTITVKPQAPTLTAAGGFVESKSVTITKADGEAEGAAIKYSTDDGETWNVYSEALTITATTTVQAKVDQSGISSTIASATYTKVTPKTQRTVSSSETWDWSAATGENVNLSNETNPAKDADLDVVAANFDGAVYQWDCGFPSNFDAIVMYKFQRPKNSAYYQGQTIKIHTDVTGIISVQFANTGGKRPNRYLSVNGTIYGEGSGDESSASKRTVEVPVAAGDITLTGIYEPNEANYEHAGEDGYKEYNADDAGKAQYLNYYKITFTQTYAVNCATPSNGTLAADKSLAAAGEKVTLTVTPNANYEIASVTLNGEPIVPEEDVYSFTMPEGEANVVATFSAINYTITCSPAENGSVSAKATANYGEVVTLTISPESGYKLNSLIVKDAEDADVEVADNKFTMPASNVTVTATFVEDSGTGIDNTADEIKAVKFIENGQLFIRRGEKVYTITGEEVR